MSNRKPTFLLGVGCQKAGTTWLYSYLDGHPQTVLPTPKELHVFDAMLRPEMFQEFYLRAQSEHRNRGIRRRLADRLLPRKPGRHVEPGMLLEMISNPPAYVDFFSSIGREADLVGEITPSYAALARDDFVFIRGLLEPHFDLKVILLLRDPIDRAFSAVRHFRKQKDRFPTALDRDDNTLFSRLYNTPYVWERANYPATIENLEAAFGANQVHIGFFETMFSDAAISEICAFLGLSQHAANFNKHVNVSPMTTPLDPDLAKQARHAYDPIYTYCADRFGHKMIKSIWTGY